ncbi:hypothetical protein JMN32_23880 [Fulvivirga sp. 29W222]|uniref:Methionyl-tRNA formyltransferase n=1 Tax=Fulvivirga marina TaxID=2494733 RepID=A0A937KE55_9BACT|nr:formyltransferase family protein [Fulvivirga marina]MBL6449372.1 hypothetical protein [Fulvivirga marina]
MKIVVFTNSSWGIPLLLELTKTNKLQGIIIPSVVHHENENIEAFAIENKIPIIRVRKEELRSTLKDWLNELSPDLAFCMTFPYLLPEEILTIPSKGVVNFHFGQLPDYGGADPLFWVLKEQQTVAHITAHLMAESFDKGYQVYQEQVPIYPGENWGLLGARLSLVSASLADKIITLLNLPESNFKKIPEGQSKKKPDIKDLTINWANQTADSIEALVNASNPKYGGAITYFRGSMVRILEVSPADVSNAALLSPGSIVHADGQNGIFVLCSDYRFLRINILRTPEAYITGHKLAALGVKSNEKFNSNYQIEKKEKAESSLIL